MLLMRVFLVVFIGMAAWSVVAPRSQWALCVSWQYRHPEAQEPSNAAYIGIRIIGALAVLFGLFMWNQLSEWQ